MSEEDSPHHRLMTLSESHIAMLLRFADVHNEENSMGVELANMTVFDVPIVETLVDQGLATKSIGWLSSCWYRLSPIGWTVVWLLRPR